MRHLALPALLLLLACQPKGELPARLSKTGRFGGQGVVATEVRAFTPQYPLWTDGADKGRWAYLPAGAKVDTRNPRFWDFPVGTRFWKDIGSADRRVETRFMWKVGQDRWLFATYAWRADQRDADLVPAQGRLSDFEVAPGVRHRLPSLSDCRSCHEVGRVQVLGFSDRQLPTPQRTPWSAAGQIPATQALPDTASDRDRAALGWLMGNCAGCHQDQGPWSTLGLHLHAPDPALATTLGVPGFFRIRDMDPSKQARIVPGHPERSTLLRRISVRGSLEQMPPTGSARVDDKTVALVEAWIKEMK